MPTNSNTRSRCAAGRRGLVHSYRHVRRKKVDYLIPLPEKARQFVLLSGDEIVWLVGRHLDEPTGSRPRSKTLRITKRSFATAKAA